MRKLFLVLVLTIFTFTANAQTQIQNSGWLALFNSAKLNDRWGIHFDAQFRSADNWSYLRNVLIRPGVTYFINSSSNVTAGYLYVNTHTQLPAGDSNLQEQRIWEQFIYNHKIKSNFITHRLRLEQRFIETNSEDLFAQRLRYFIRAVKPLQRQPEFSKGLFIALQNELFFNVQNNDALNGSLFDQNRFLIGLGYRLSRKVDVEAGYLNQYINGAAANTSNRVAQLGLYTRF